MATIIIPTPLRKFTDNLSKVEVSGGSVVESLEQLIESYPELSQFLLSNDGGISSRIYLYLDYNHEPIKNMDEVVLSMDSVLNIVPSIKGGKE